MWAARFAQTRSNKSDKNKLNMMTIQKAHERLGHTNEELTRKTAKLLGWTISKGVLGNCEYCAIGKAKQKNIIQKSKHIKAKIPGYRIFLDIKTLCKPKEKNILL